MFDQSKRHTLKMLGGTSLIAMPIFAMADGSGIVAGNGSDSAKPEYPELVQSSGMPLQIQIIDTMSVPDNNVILRNTSDEELCVSRFMPGHIYFNEQIIDLNEAIGKRSLILQAGRSKVFDFKVWPVLNAGPVEYVWADHAIEQLNNDTSVITLGAFMADTNAVVYANTRQPMIT